MNDKKKTDTGAGAAMQVPQPAEIMPTEDLICPFLSGGMVMAMAQARQHVLSATPQPAGVIQQPVRYYMTCVKERCSIWDGENECCGILTAGSGEEENE